jgi:hypothetical protein
MTAAAERALAHCGVRAQDVALTWDDELQDATFTFKGADGRSPPGPAAVSRAAGARPLWGTYRFSSEKTQRRFNALEAAAGQPAEQRMRQDARRRLAARGQLGRVPRFDPRAETLAAFARKLEVFCGFEPGSMLWTRGRTIYIRPQHPERLRFADFERLMDVLWSSVPKHVPIILVGGEAPGPDLAVAAGDHGRRRWRR